MAARDQQQQIGKGHVFAETHRQRMAFEVIDRQQRLVVREGQRLGGHDAHHHAADQARPAGGGNAVELVEAQSGLFQRLDKDSIDAFEMGTGGELGIDDIGAEESERRADSGRGDIRRLDHGNRSLVAACFDTQHAHPGLLALPAGLR